MGADISVVDEEGSREMEKVLCAEEEGMARAVYDACKAQLLTMRQQQKGSLSEQISSHNDLEELEAMATAEEADVETFENMTIQLEDGKELIVHYWRNPDAAVVSSSLSSSSSLPSPSLVILYTGFDPSEVVPLCRNLNACLITFPTQEAKSTDVLMGIAGVVKELRVTNPAIKFVLYSRGLDCGWVVKFLHDAPKPERKSVLACVLDTPYYSVKRIILEQLHQNGGSHSQPLLEQIMKMTGTMLWRQIGYEICAEVGALRKPGKLVHAVKVRVHLINAVSGMVNPERHGHELARLWHSRGHVTTSSVASHLGRRDRLLMLEVAEAIRPNVLASAQPAVARGMSGYMPSIFRGSVRGNVSLTVSSGVRMPGASVPK